MVTTEGPPILGSAPAGDCCGHTRGPWRCVREPHPQAPHRHTYIATVRPAADRKAEAS